MICIKDRIKKNDSEEIASYSITIYTEMKSFFCNEMDLKKYFDWRLLSIYLVSTKLTIDQVIMKSIC
jgi:hypothetical protein